MYWSYAGDCYLVGFVNFFYALNMNMIKTWEKSGVQHIQMITYRIMYVLAWQTVYALTRGLFWCLFPELRSNEGNKYQNNTRVSTWTVRHKSTYIILSLTWHNESINYAKNKDLGTSSPCLTRSLYVLLMTSQPIGDDVTKTRQLWREHMTSDIYLVRYWFYSWRYSRPVM